MRLGVGLVAAAAFLAMLLLDTQAVLEVTWMAALGRLGVWPQRLLVGVALCACGVAIAGLRRRPRKAGRASVPRRATPQVAPGKAARKGSHKPGPKGRRPAAPGVASAAGRGPARPSRA